MIKMKTLRLLLLSIVFTGASAIVFGWGAWGHRHINKAAIFSLPVEMRTFYYNHADYIAEASVIPDLRRYWLNDQTEAPRHFFDVEDFRSDLDDLPRTSKEAFEKYDSVFLSKAGILPWYIQDMTQKLTTAFRKKNKGEILFLSSELAHYIGDAHMPLHTSSNYNGQLTGQKGVHALWESRLPPMFGHLFNFRTDQATYIDDIQDYTWKMIKQSHSLVQPLLAAELRVRSRFDSSEMYLKSKDGQRVLSYNAPVFSNAYAQAFQEELGSMVEDQMRLSIQHVASYWYTAWVQAGKPDLSNLDHSTLTRKNRKSLNKEYRNWKKGKIMYLGYGGLD